MTIWPAPREIGTDLRHSTPLSTYIYVHMSIFFAFLLISKRLSAKAICARVSMRLIASLFMFFRMLTPSRVSTSYPLRFKLTRNCQNALNSGSRCLPQIRPLNVCSPLPAPFLLLIHDAEPICQYRGNTTQL
jgi:hypothetical protein